MGAIKDIQSWIDINKRLYKTELAPFLNSPEYKKISSADLYGKNRIVAAMVKSWKSKSGTISNTNWIVESFDDSQDMSAIPISEEFFLTVTSSMASSLDYNIAKSRVEKGISHIKDGLFLAELAERNYYVTGTSQTTLLGRILIMTGLTMILSVFHPYHLYVNFAWDVDREKKYKNFEESVYHHYTFFTNSQWIPLVNLAARSVRNPLLDTLVSDVTSKHLPSGKGIQDMDLMDFKNYAQGLSNLGYGALEAISASVSLPLSKLFIDAYTPE